MTLQEMLEKRAKLVADARKIVDGKDITAEQRAQADAMLTDAAALKTDIERVQRVEAEERELAASQGRKSDPANVDNRGSVKPIVYRGLELPVTNRCTPAYAAAFRNYIRGEMRTPASFANDVDADGGYLHAPQQFVANLMQSLDDAVFIRRYATVIPVTTSDSLGRPTLDTDAADADWTGEVATITPDETLQIGTRELKPMQLTKAFKVSMKLMATSAIDPVGIVNNRFAAVFGRTEEKAFLTGNGTTAPLGVYTASADGINTDRDVSTGNTASAVTFDGLINAKYSIKAQYRNGLRWMFHRDGVKKISLLKDGNGQYIWQPSKVAGDPDMLLGYPLDESEWNPNTWTSGLYVGLLGNWAQYWIADLVGFGVQRLNELYAMNSQVGFVGRKYTDGMPQDSKAFARVKLG